MAYLRYLCGTTNFSVRIGETNIEGGRIYPGENNGAKTGDPVYDASKSEKYGDFPKGLIVQGYDPNQNNIFVTVYSTNDLDNVKEYGGKKVSFPTPGNVPRIIACNTTVNPSNEGINFNLAACPLIITPSSQQSGLIQNSGRYEITSEQSLTIKNENKKSVTIYGEFSNVNPYISNGQLSIGGAWNPNNKVSVDADLSKKLFSFDLSSIMGSVQQNEPFLITLSDGWNFQIEKIIFE